jgi:hypothetical protein
MTRQFMVQHLMYEESENYRRKPLLTSYMKEY